MYQGFFLRQPDPSGMGYWMRMWSGGLGLSDIAYNFANSDEFRVRYGSLRNDQFVDLVYRNVLCRTPDPEDTRTGTASSTPAASAAGT